MSDSLVVEMSLDLEYVCKCLEKKILKLNIAAYYHVNTLIIFMMFLSNFVINMASGLIPCCNK